MHRTDLLDKLSRHVPADPHEAAARRRIIAFVKAHPDCFERTLKVGHVTGSAWVVDNRNERVLLTHHRKLDRWLQLGGHCDGDPDVLAVALREAREESGMESIVPVRTDIFDVDVHYIPLYGQEPGHYHYDVRFLLRADGDETCRVSDESHDLAWVMREQFPRLHTDESVMRMYRKWLLE